MWEGICHTEFQFFKQIIIVVYKNVFYLTFFYVLRNAPLLKFFDSACLGENMFRHEKERSRIWFWVYK